MTQDNRPKLSDSQLELMDILWDMGEASVTDVWRALPRERQVARNTVMTVLVRLAEKGWLERRKQGSEFVYTPTVEREEALGGMISRLLDVAFGGSAEQLMLTLVNSRGISREEADRLRRIIDESSRKRR